MGPYLTFYVLQVFIMKFFIAFMAFLALASAQEHTCDECKAGITKLGQYLLTDAELAAVEEALADLVCPTLPEENIEGCIAGVYAWWPKVAEALFTWPETATNLCAGLGYCKKRNPKLLDIFTPRVTCADCVKELGRISDLLKTDEFSMKVAEDLRGPIFCGNPTYIPAEQAEACVGFMSAIDVASVKALGDLVKVSAENLQRKWLRINY